MNAAPVNTVCRHYGAALNALARYRGVASAPGGAAIAITFHKDQVERAAVIEAYATHAIALEVRNAMSGPTPDPSRGRSRDR